MQLAEAAEEGGVRGVAEPALAHEGGGKADADDDLDEQVVVAEHLGYGVGPQPLAIPTRQVVNEIHPETAAVTTKRNANSELFLQTSNTENLPDSTTSRLLLQVLVMETQTVQHKMKKKRD